MSIKYIHTWVNEKDEVCQAGAGKIATTIDEAKKTYKQELKDFKWKYDHTMEIHENGSWNWIYITDMALEDDLNELFPAPVKCEQHGPGQHCGAC